ncbi:MAG: hypothetical protein ACRCT2_11200, partial [Plesiomonas shigelloides]
DSTWGPLASSNAKTLYFGLQQGPHQTLLAYYDTFKNARQVLSTIGSKVGPDLRTVELITEEFKIAGKTNSTRKVEEEALELESTLKFLGGADRTRYGEILDDLANDKAKGQENYPRTVSDAYTLLNTWSKTRSQSRRDTSGGMAYYAAGDEESEGQEGTANATKGKKQAQDKSKWFCKICGKQGHAPWQTDICQGAEDDETDGKAEAPKKGSSMTTYGTLSEGVALAAAAKGELEPTWILLDNQSNVDVFGNPDLLSNIRRASGTLTLHSTGGTVSVNMEGDWDGYGTVWYLEGALANILSFSRVRDKKFKIEYDPDAKDPTKDVFKIVKQDGTVRTFHRSAGLYVSEAFAQAGNISDGTALVSTVDDNKSRYTVADYERAAKVRELQRTVGRPNDKDFIRMLERKLLPNCPFTRRDVAAAEDIWGPDLGSLKGKTVRRPPHQVRGVLADLLPAAVMEQYRAVTICCDIMFVNKIAFLVTISRDLKFGTIQAIANKKLATVLGALKEVFKRYRTGGFTVAATLMDGEFEPTRGDLAAMSVALNTTGRDEHVGEIERYI